MAVDHPIIGGFTMLSAAIMLAIGLSILPQVLAIGIIHTSVLTIGLIYDTLLMYYLFRIDMDTSFYSGPDTYEEIVDTNGVITSLSFIFVHPIAQRVRRAIPKIEHLIKETLHVERVKTYAKQMTTGDDTGSKSDNTDTHDHGHIPKRGRDDHYQYVGQNEVVVNQYEDTCIVCGEDIKHIEGHPKLCVKHLHTTMLIAKYMRTESDGFK